MNAMILAAGLGTRLKPWTLEHPKALVPVGGVPMLERVIERLKSEGFDRIIVNIHHFGEQILDFLNSRDFGVKILVSDERNLLLDTGGGVRQAWPIIGADEPLLVHNVDILSNAPLGELMQNAIESEADAMLMVSGRDSSRKLIFDPSLRLTGWRNLKTGEVKVKNEPLGDNELAFSGIYVLNPKAMESIQTYPERFPIMDYFLSKDSKIKGYQAENLQLIDIGKPETLSRANNLLLQF